jgi:thiamine-phosphate pyrophosphorylase
MNREILRILDANVNRAVEGVRVLEEAARMLFNDTALTDELKDLRHGIARILAETKGVGSRLILARDSEGDVLREGETSSERTRTDVSSVIRANARRACEAVRSLEEYGKLVDSSLSGRYKRVRFRLYDLEKKLMERAFRQKLLSVRRLGVWVIIDHGESGGLAAHLAETAVEAGAGTIVFRDKASSDRLFLSHAEPLVTACSAKDAAVLVNDRVDAAVMLGADGVVLGEDDTPLALARSLVGEGMLVGRSGSWIGACPPESMESADFLLLAAGWERRSLGEVIRDSPAPVIASFVPNEGESGDILESTPDYASIIRGPLTGIAGISLYAEQYRPDDLAGVVACMRKEFEHRNL